MNTVFAKSLQLLPAVLLLLAGESVANASYVQLTSSAQLTAGNSVASYAQPDLVSVPSPFSETAGGNTVRFSTGSNAPFLVQHQGTSFFGDFPSGTPLLYNAGNGPDLIAFSLPITQFGVSVESNVVASHNFTVTLLSGSTTAFSYTFSDDGFSSFFLGAQGTAGSTFDSVRIASSDNDFAIGPVSFSASTAAVPEPSSWLLLSTAAVFLSGMRLRSRRNR